MGERKPTTTILQISSIILEPEASQQASLGITDTTNDPLTGASTESDFTTALSFVPKRTVAHVNGENDVSNHSAARPTRPHPMSSQHSFLSAHSSTDPHSISASTATSRSASAMPSTSNMFDLNIAMASTTLESPTESKSIASVSPTAPYRQSAHATAANSPTSSKRTEPVLPNAKVDAAAPSDMYWSRVPAGGRAPKALRAHSATTVGNSMWVFGGCDMKGTCFKELYKYDTETYTWSKPRVIGTIPPTTRAHSAVAVGDKLYVFGGGDGPTYYNDLYCFDTYCSTWTKLNTIGVPPSPRRAHAAIVYDSHMIVFGGGNGCTALNDVHALDMRNPRRRLRWKQLNVQGSPPVPRGYHSMNLVGSKAVVFGGSDGTECFGDIFVLDLDNLIWTEINPEHEPGSLEIFPRLSHTCSTLGSYLVVLGGHDGREFSEEILFFNLVTLEWERRKASGQAPVARGYHSTVLHNGILATYGGFDGKNVFNELHFLDLASLAFLPQITRFEIGQSEDE